MTDYENVRELVRVNGDLGRLGGWLKLWPTDDARTARFGVDTILALLGKIEATQDKMSGIMESVVLDEVFLGGAAGAGTPTAPNHNPPITEVNHG